MCVSGLSKVTQNPERSSRCNALLQCIVGQFPCPLLARSLSAHDARVSHTASHPHYRDGPRRTLCCATCASALRCSHSTARLLSPGNTLPELSPIPTPMGTTAQSSWTTTRSPPRSRQSRNPFVRHVSILKLIIYPRVTAGLTPRGRAPPNPHPKPSPVRSYMLCANRQAS